MDTIISCENIVKSFGVENEKRNVLNGVSLDIHEGEFVSVMGPSGSGKTTLMFALSGMDAVDSGTVVFDGSSLSTLSENKLADIRRTKMGFVFQQPTLLRNLNILDNIILPSMRDRKKDREGLSEKAIKLMEKADISGLENRQTTQASGGQLQRVGICRALMHDPKVIFGDEPTGALNSKSANEIMRLLAGIHQTGTTILLVTHDAKIAARTERVLFMIDGNITGEYQLGAYNQDPEELKKREEKLNSWLTEKEVSDLKTAEMGN